MTYCIVFLVTQMIVFNILSPPVPMHGGLLCITFCLRKGRLFHFVFQSFASMESAFGKCLMVMLQTDVSNLTGTLPKLERLRGTLRLMFNPCPRYKVEKSILLSLSRKGCLQPGENKI